MWGHLDLFTWVCCFSMAVVISSWDLKAVLILSSSRKDVLTVTSGNRETYTSMTSVPPLTYQSSLQQGSWGTRGAATCVCVCVPYLHHNHTHTQHNHMTGNTLRPLHVRQLPEQPHEFWESLGKKNSFHIWSHDQRMKCRTFTLSACSLLGLRAQALTFI